MGSLAMKATERDPDFLRNFEKAVKNKRQQSEQGLGGERGGGGGKEGLLWITRR